MNSNLAGSSKKTYGIDDEEDEVFDDSFLVNFENTTFKENSKLPNSEVNTSLNKSELNVSALCCDEELSGYDKLTGRTWIYPTNYPVRDYQFNIINAAILKNTLVSLPTGLGKTFIAAVIMYNFYRWYPLGKIIFTAPTRPLVAQQIDACYNIIAIPPNDTIEMTGHMQVNTRKIHWQSKRVFFATPQVIYNDIKSGICPSDKIRCLVIDEAHRARGNYAYCQIVSTLTDMGHKTYRTLALSATPGSKVEDVVNVVKNLRIAHLELRSEGSIDVAPYSHSRNINTVVIKLGTELTQLRQQFIEILDGYARRLKQCNILPQNLGNLSKGRIVMLYKEFQSKERGTRHPQHSNIMKDFTLLITLYHGLELLIKHGSRVFLNFFDSHPEKSWMQDNDRLTMLLERLRDDLGVNPLSLNRSILPDGTVPELPKDLCFGHPKFDKLKEIMMEHFAEAKRNGQDTRAIVFCEYRESVNLVHCLLLQCRPLIMPQMFVGQGGAAGKEEGVTQRQQLRAMRAFVAGACNVLVATCVAEEGLDVGSVDLILCFDVSSRSPVRLVQRCGRTGRERGGQVYILVTEGREHQTLLESMRQRDGLNAKILHSKEVENSLYRNNPRMIPHDFTPVCQKMYITVAKKNEPKTKHKDAIEKSKKGQKDLRSMLFGASTSTSNSNTTKKAVGAGVLITEMEFGELYPDGFLNTSLLPEPKEYWAMNKDQIRMLSKKESESELKLHTWLEWQRSLQNTVNIGHSKDSEILTSLLQYGDAKRFEMIPSTQNPNFYTQDIATQNVIMPSPAKTKQNKKNTKVISTKSPRKKDGDIRALFSVATKSTKSYTKLINELGIQNHDNIPTSLFNLLVDLSLDSTNATRECYVCLNMFDCTFFKNIKQYNKTPPMSLRFLTEPKFPDLDLIDDITTNSLRQYEIKAETKNTLDPAMNLYSIDKQPCEDNDELNLILNEQFDIDTIQFTQEESNTKSPTIDIKYIANKHVSQLDNNKLSNKPIETTKESEDKNFEIGDLEDIFADSSPEEVIAMQIKDEKVCHETEDEPKAKEVLSFFKLDSIEDIFADSDSSECKTVEENNNKDIKVEVSDFNKTVQENPVSPSILSGRTILHSSPILTQSSKSKLNLSRRRLFDIPKVSDNTEKSQCKNEDPKTSQMCKSNLSPTFTEPNNKSMFSITQLVDMINKSDNDNSNVQISLFKKEDTFNEEERCTSPIILTQADRKKTNTLKISPSASEVEKKESLIIIESDSDSSDTIVYNADSTTNTQLPAVNKGEFNDTNITPVNNKRKFDCDLNESELITSSPYFNKKQKLDNNTSKPMTLQEKVLASLTSNKMDDFMKSNNSNVNFLFSPQKKMSQKENKCPPELFNKLKLLNDDENEGSIRKNNLDMLQMFRRDNKVKSITKSNKTERDEPLFKRKRKISCDDSDDDFVDNEKCRPRKLTNCETQLPASQKHMNGGVKVKPSTNHKVRKKKENNDFLDLEAELSYCSGDSGDELTDDSVGSIIDFICDENTIQEDHNKDMHAHYLQSVRSPVKGVFKIPNLPKKYDKEVVFSQFVPEEDTYEMDSFCVDSHIGLTQTNDISELELAEKILEEKRRAKKSRKAIPQDTGDSPVVSRRNKNARQIQSDSDDSS